MSIVRGGSGGGGSQDFARPGSGAGRPVLRAVRRLLAGAAPGLSTLGQSPSVDALQALAVRATTAATREPTRSRLRTPLEDPTNFSKGSPMDPNTVNPLPGRLATLLAAAVRAPSLDNTQPWRFTV